MALIDVKKQFDEVKNAAVSAVKSIFPVEKKDHKLELENVYVEDKAEINNYSQQSKVKGRGGSWGANVYADLVLRDTKANKIIDRQKKVKLFLLPKMTPRASYIVKGNEYQVSNQLRLRPGAYVKKTKTGDVKTQINLAKGGAAEIFIDSKNIIKMKVSQAKIPLYPLLIGMGISENQIRSVWGNKVLDQNKETSTSSQAAVKRFAKAFARVDTENFDTAKEGLQAYINEKTEIDPEMTNLTLGKNYKKFSPLLWLDASKKLVDVEKGDKQPDDVDNLAFKEVFGADDAIKERIEKNKNNLVYKINRGLGNKEKISQIINVGTFGDLVEKFFTEDDRSSTPEQINPLHMYSNHEKISFLGPGSISSTQLATDEMRSVHPTHLSFVDPVHTPESERIGLNLALTLGAKKKDKNLVAGFYNTKTGKMEDLKPVQVFEKIVAYPDQWDFKTKKFKSQKVKAQHKGKLVVVPPSKVEYVMPFAQNAFALSTNMIPFMANDNGNRTMMAGKHMEQAIPLKDREAPLVQNKMPVGKDVSFEETVGATQAVYATEDGSKEGKPVSGKVKKVTKDAIVIKSGKEDIKIPIYNNFSLNQKTFMHNSPTVKEGDKVEAGQLIADSNYTKDGVLSLGRSLTTAYMPYKGYNFEDGIVISESAAQKLTSEHIHKKEIGVTPKTVLSLGKFIANFPNDIGLENRKKLDDSGIIKKGSRVKYGDIVVAALKNQGGPVGAEAIKRRLHKSLGKDFKNISEYWGMDVEGIVTDVQKTADKITVYIRTEEPAKIGDKLAGRHGNKGIITKIIPDSHSPRTKDGDPVEIIMNPHGVISRINIGQMYESAMGKAAKKSGKPYKVENFAGKNYLEETKKELKKAGIEDTEELIDPMTGKTMGKVHVGNPYILKLNKQSEVNFSVRGEQGPVAKTTLQPVKGGEEGSKALDMLTMYSLLSHGSRANLKEMSTLKSENNPEYWEALKYGRHLPAPKVPFVFEKFQNMLRGAGVDVKKNGSRFQLMPMTDEDTKKLSKMKIEKPRFLHAKGDRLIEEKGGFVDSTNLGGMQGDNWGHIELKESVPNPVFEKAIIALLGIVESEYDEIMSSKKTVNIDGKELTGPKAIKTMLSKIDVEKEIKEVEPKLEKLKGSNLNKATQKYRYLKVLKEKNLSPVKAYTRKLVPVVPPKFRPLSVMESGDIAGDDSNWIYRNIGLINDKLNLPVTDLLEDQDLAGAKKELYQQLKGLSGLADVKFAGKDKRGFIAQIKGKNQPKEGFFQSKVLRKNQNLVGRGTIIPEPQLHMDEAAIPEKMAWKLYNPFVMKELTRSGLSAQRAKEEIEKKTPLAKKILENTMGQRPMMLNRAPSLHKFSIMAFKPKITEGKAIKIPPLVVSGFNADFDGDTMTAHIPVGDQAVREAFRMMPSRNLYKPGTGSLIVGPSQESQLGFYLMTKTQEGRKRLNAVIPKEYKITKEMDKKASKELFMKLSKNMSNEKFSTLIDKVKVMGEAEATSTGFSLALKDIDILPNKDKIIQQIEREAKKAMDDPSLRASFEKKLTQKGGMQDQVDDLIKKHLKGKDNSFYEMVNSGARGNMGQLRQIVASPLILKDPDGNVVPKTIEKSFAEGLDLSDYWISSYGARRGMMDRALSTRDPGVFNKSLMAATMQNVVSMEDCGTKDYIKLPINDSDILGRFLQTDQGGYSDETIIDEDVLKTLKKKGLKELKVRSPLKCEAPKGTCRHCYGVDESGKVVSMGDNLGAKTTQTIAEPMTQLTMNTFHTGGVAGTGRRNGYQRIQDLIYLPKNIKAGKATLATKAGTIEKVEDSGFGGYNVFIDGKKHVTGKGLPLKVKKGSSVKKGDPLSEGSIVPQELLELKNMKEVQEYMTNELKSAYQSEGVNIDRKTFETVVKSITDRTQVINDLKELPYSPGDTMRLSEAENYNKNSGDKPKLIHRPYLAGVNTIPTKNQDWMSQMGAHHIADAVIKGASQGWFSDVKDYHPIPAFAYGATFGEGKEGRY